MSTLRFAAAAAVLLILAGACASSGTSSSQAGDCALQPADSVFTKAGPVYRDCAVTTKARLLNPDLRPDFQMSGSGCNVAELEYVVTADGVADTRTARVRRTNNQAFADAVLTLLTRRRFEPATRNGVPVAQIVDDKLSVGAVVVVVREGQRPPPMRPGPGC